MKKKPQFLLGLILIFILFGILLQLPQTRIPVKFTTPPLLNKQIVVDKKIGIDAASLLKNLGINRDISFRKGLDLEGGTSITLQANMKDIPEAQRKDALESAKNVIERRVNFFGVAEPVVQTAKVGNDYRIIAEIPGVTDVKQAVDLIGQTAKLTFWESGDEKTASTAGVPLGATIFLGPNPQKTNLTGADLQKAQVGFDQQNGSPVVELHFTPTGAKKFADITAKNVGKVLAMALDTMIIEAPRVDETITGGNAIIRGSFTTQTAKQLAIQLNAGALPVELSVLEQRAIGASLGKESLDKSLIAGSIGFCVIVAFMVVLYGRLGVIASIALAIYTLLTLSLFRLIPVTLTLAGIAGLILSIGIAVDANILIFERMKEELRHGRQKNAALEIGFVHAMPSIRDSNMASLITSAVLYMTSVGSVRGFALTLAIGVIVSYFSAVIITRTLLRYLYN